MAEPGREGRLKRRDDLEDNTTAPVYTGEPLPPFLFAVEDLHYCCFQVDRDRVLPHLPPEVHLAEPATAILLIYRTGEGWGLNKASGGLLTVVVDNFRSPDTGEATWIVGGFMSAPAQDRLSRHFASFDLGWAEFEQSAQDRRAEISGKDGMVVRVGLKISDPVPPDMATIDRYLGRNQEGDLTSSLWSAVGKNFICDLSSVEFGPGAPDIWRDFAPTELEWGVLVPFMLANFSPPEPLVPPQPGASLSRAGLLQIFNQLGRAACILGPDGRILHSNAEAVGLLDGTAAARSGRMDLPPGPERARFLAALLPGQERHLPDAFVLPRAGASPLVLQLAPLDPAMTELGSALLLISDPGAQREPVRVGLLQLMNLTQAEARIAATVGSGLSPREAAVRLGLTEATVRSTLKVVYDKLGVRRQAELVRLVGRLDPG